jgi:hypothetical protein
MQHGQHTENLFSAKAEDFSEHVRNEKQDISEDVPNEPEQEQVSETETGTVNEEEKSRLKELQMENYELRVQLEGQKHLIRKFDELTDKERDRHGKETMALVDRLTDARHQIGSLEEKLLQIEAPKGSTHEAEVTDVENKAPEGESRAGEWKAVV